MFGPNDVIQDPEKFHLKFFNFLAFKDGPAHAFESRLDFAEGEKLDIALGPRHGRQTRKKGTNHRYPCPPAIGHRFSLPFRTPSSLGLKDLSRQARERLQTPRLGQRDKK